ncbi:TPA: hypothetical protein ACH3X2_003168 [Trebouxia sp. C0005]
MCSEYALGMQQEAVAQQIYPVWYESEEGRTRITFRRPIQSFPCPKDSVEARGDMKVELHLWCCRHTAYGSLWARYTLLDPPHMHAVLSKCILLTSADCGFTLFLMPQCTQYC